MPVINPAPAPAAWKPVHPIVPASTPACASCCLQDALELLHSYKLENANLKGKLEILESMVSALHSNAAYGTWYRAPILTHAILPMPQRYSIASPSPAATKKRKQAPEEGAAHPKKKVQVLQGTDDEEEFEDEESMVSHHA